MKEGKKRGYGIFCGSGGLSSVRAHLTEQLYRRLPRRCSPCIYFGHDSLSYSRPLLCEWATFHKFLVIKFRGTGKGVNHVLA